MKKLAELREMVEDTLLVGAISMAYLDEGGVLRRAELPIEDDEPTTDDWARLREKADTESRVFEVLSMSGGRVIMPNGDKIAGTPDDNTLLEALTLADCNRGYHLSAR